MVGRLVVVAVVALWAQGALAQAGTWFTTPQILKEFFAASDRVSFVDIDGADLKARGIATQKEKHHVYVAFSGDRVDGYAIIDDEKGLHEPISFAVLLSADLVVQRIEVMAYREAYGAEIRAPRYRKQWVGKTLADLQKPIVDVDSVSGATVSCKSTVAMVRRALVLGSLAQQQQKKP